MNLSFTDKYLLCMILFALSLNLYAIPSKNAELISYYTTVTIKNNKLTRHQSYDIGIYNREGEKYSEISIPFSSMNKISNISASIKTLEGTTIKKLNKSDISERNSFPTYSFYEDQFVKEFTLKHNQYPYIIHVEYDDKEDEFLYIDYWYPILDIDIPTTDAVLIIEAPKDYKLNFYSQLAKEAMRDSTEDNYIYKWSANYDGTVKTELFTPPLNNYLPVVTAVPENFNYEISGSFASWNSYGLWQSNLLQNISDIPDHEIKIFKSLVKGLENREEIIKTLYHYLQDETRYINISLETGGLKPHPASFVSQNHYGDCKALSNYFKAVLQSVDIESFYTKIYAGDVIRKIHHEIPSQQSNHIILCIPNEKDTMWIDCTSKDPFNYTGTFIQNREVFVINENKSFFSKTPALQPEQVLKEREVFLKLNPGNVTTAEFNTTYRGKQFEILNQLNNTYNEKEKEEIIRDIVMDNRFEPINVTTFNKQDRDSAKVTLKYSARSSDIYKKYGNDLVIKLLTFYIPNFEAPADRKYPVQINYPIYQADKLIYQIPTEYNLSDVLLNHAIENKYGKYEIKSEVSEDKVIISKSFLLYSGNYPLEEYIDFFEFIKTINKLETTTYLTSSKYN